jgi:5-methyltetrahydrofolate--homocysteine methyltransferase
LYSSESDHTTVHACTNSIFLLDIFQYLHDTLSERIMIIDGAMGTMIQQHNLDEDAFRGMNIVHVLYNGIYVWDNTS